ncbi:MAG: acetyl-coenzyme A synthetase [Fimbriimonadales bacterium]|nr:MAG: acetyl-coenzyme A synthetase [Fimbriimonadales bacterium]
MLKEGRHFPPPEEFVAQANVSDPSVYDRANRDPVGFWSEWANRLDWFEPWQNALEWEPPYARWFTGGKLNACYNCVDRHVQNGKGDRVALIWEGEPGEVVSWTYAELQAKVCQIANALKQIGVKKGEIVCLYMPMVPEIVAAMLACARIGAPHSVVFAGFSADSLRDRINDAKAVAVLTADGGWRRGKVLPLKQVVDEALAETPSVRNVIVLERLGEEHLTVEYKTGRDLRWSEIVDRQPTECPCEPMDSEDLLFTLYTSGSTGKPKGIVHTTAGYLTGVMATYNWIFDHKESDLFWCTADCGWVTGHSYIVYGPLANGASILLYEGAPDTPDKDRFWRIVERHRVTVLYTAPTAIRAFMKWGDEYPERCDLSSLRLLGSVGEPINPEAWVWYWKVIGGGRCPIVDTWWQTETGHILISPLPGITTCKPGSASRPFPGIRAEVYDESGNPIEGPGGGYLVITHPWPGMLRGLFNDPERYVETYWSRFHAVYFPADGVKRDEEGDLWLLGRVDDVMNVSGHRISTMEVESALVDHPAVAEAAVIGRHDDLKGQAISAFVVLRAGWEGESLKEEIRNHVSKVIGPIARPEEIFLCADLPKTRSGKIMRRLLRDIAEGRALGDTTTLADAAVVEGLRKQYEHLEA